MAGVKAATLAAIINSTPMAGWVEALGLSDTFIFGVLGGLTPKLGNYQFNAITAGNATAGSFLESATLTTAGAQTRVRVTFQPKRYYATIAVDGLQEVLAAGGGYDQISDVIADEAARAVNDIFDDINTDSITSGSGADVNGVVYHISTGSFSPGGTATEDKFVNVKHGDLTRIEAYSSFLVSAQTGSLTTSSLDTVHKGLVDERKSNYNALWTSETQLEKYENLASDKRRYVSDVGDTRFVQMQYKGRPVIAVPGYDTDRVDFVRTMDWKFWYSEQVSKTSELRGPFKVMPMSKTTDDDTFALVIYGNLICVNPYKQGAVVALAT